MCWPISSIIAVRLYIVEKGSVIELYIENLTLKVLGGLEKSKSLTLGGQTIYHHIGGLER